MIGSVRGYARPAEFEEAGLDVSESNNDLEVLKKLHKGRIDLALVDKIVGQHAINSAMPEAKEDLVFMEPAIVTEVQYLVVPKAVPGHEEVVIAFNQGLAEMTADGTLASIMTKHGF